MVTTTATPSAVRAALEAGDAAAFTTTKTAATDYLAGLVRAGLWPTPLRPMSKRPVLPRWPALPQPTTADARRWVDAMHPGAPFMGVGLRTGHGLIVADIDDPDQRAAWRAFCPRVGLDPDMPPTVTTPGAVTADGVVTHHGGGHWYILTPPDWVPPLGAVGTLKITGEGVVDGPGDTFALMVTGCQIVAPPTVRAEGDYRVTGDPQEMTPELRRWFTTTAEAARAAEATRAAERVDRDADPEKRAWEDSTPWSDVLAPAGWWVTGADSLCGCEIWHHPDAASARSATAHQCHRGTYLRVWSESCDALPQGTYSMLRASAALHHGGDYSAACTAAGFPPEAPAARAASLDLAEAVRRFAENAAAPVAALATAPDVVQSVTTSTAPEVTFDDAAYPLGHPNDPELLARIFGASPALRALFHRARAAEIYTAPVALLMGELVRTAEAAGPEAHFSTRAATGAPVRDVLSTFVVVASRSGGGKSAVTSTTAGFARGGGFQGSLTRPVERGSVASGQAVVDMLTETVMEDGEDGKARKIARMIDPAVATVEVDELASLLARSSTGGYLRDVLLSAWSGRPFGERSRTHGAKRVTGRYVLNLIGGIQPARADVLVGAEATASGLVQRLFITDVTDPWYGAEVRGEMDSGVQPCSLAELPPVPVGVEVTLPPEARADLAAEQIEVAAGTLAPEDGHLLHVRLRLACLAALWHGETVVSPALWAWTDLLMEHHRRARAMTRALCEEAAQDAETTTATRRAVGAAAASEAVTDRVAAAAESILSRIPPQGCSRRHLRDRLSRGERAHLTAALDALVAAGRVVREVGDRGAVTLKLT